MNSLEHILLGHPVWRGGGLAGASLPAVPTGFAELDRELPGGGWPVGGLVEILCAGEGIGELQLLLPALAALAAAGRRIAWIAPPHLPYAPALAAAGIDLQQLVVVQASGRRDALWAMEQVLRAGACHAALVWLRGVRYAELRRLALAAGGHSTLALLFRPAQDASETSPACLRLALEPAAGKLAATILKRRGAPAVAALGIPVRRPVHAVGGATSPAPAARSPVARPCVA